MSLAPPLAVSRPAFNPLPAYIGLFCLLWSFAFVAGKIGVTDCPPLILLTARFSLAGILILGMTALRGLGYTGLQTVSAGLGGLIVSANPVFTAGFAALFLGEQLTWRKVAGLLLGIVGVGFIVWHRMSVGTDSWHGILFTFASLASIVAGTILFKWLAPKGSLWIGNGVQNLAAGIVLLPFALCFSSVGDIVPSAGLFGAFRLPGAGRIDPGLSVMVSSIEGVRSDGGECLSLPDAAAGRHVRVARARRAHCGSRFAGHRSGRARDLSGDAARQGGAAVRAAFMSERFSFMRRHTWPLDRARPRCEHLRRQSSHLKDESMFRSRAIICRILQASLVMIVLAAVPACAQQSFGDVSGSWSGAGMMKPKDGPQERVRCKANYAVKNEGQSVKMNLLCASDAYKMDLSANIDQSGTTLSGNWFESQYRQGGSISGQNVNGLIEAKAEGETITALLTVRTKANRQTFFMESPGAWVSQVSIDLVRDAH
jgi:hypothetical protein